MEQVLSNNVNIRFISTDDINYWAELKNLKDEPKIIPLLLTKEEAILLEYFRQIKNPEIRKSLLKQLKGIIEN